MQCLGRKCGDLLQLEERSNRHRLKLHSATHCKARGTSIGAFSFKYGSNSISLPLNALSLRTLRLSAFVMGLGIGTSSDNYEVEKRYVSTTVEKSSSVLLYSAR